MRTASAAVPLLLALLAASGACAAADEVAEAGPEYDRAALMAAGTDDEPPVRQDPPDAQIRQSVTAFAPRFERASIIRDTAAAKGLTNGALMAGIGQVETGFAHCWSEATWACRGLASPSCGGGPVIAGAADGPCSARQGGLGMFQFDAGTFEQTIARDGEKILLLEGNVEHAVDFVFERVRQEVASVSNPAEAAAWMNDIVIARGSPRFEQWIAIVSCRYNGCCGCSNQEEKYRQATLDLFVEFGPDFWTISEAPEPGDDPGTPGDEPGAPGDEPDDPQTGDDPTTPDDEGDDEGDSGDDAGTGGDDGAEAGPVDEDVAFGCATSSPAPGALAPLLLALVALRRRR